MGDGSLKWAGVASVRCGRCGWFQDVGDNRLGNVRDDPGAIARTAARHLELCAGRWRGHRAFGFEPRWTSQVLGDNRDEIVVWWGTPSGEYSGFPFDIDAALAAEGEDA